jgi:hypothetical protein
MRFPFDTIIDRDDEEIEVRVIYDVRPGDEPCPHGDYPHPGYGAEIEIISVRRDGQDFTLTDAEETKLIAECEERAERDVAEEAAAAADWKYQEHRDRQLMEKWERRP